MRTLLSTWFGCVPADIAPVVAESPAPTEAESPPSSTSASAAPTDPPPPLVCPVIAEGDNRFEAAGLVRRVVIHLPPAVEPGMPVLLMFHGRGQRAEDMVQAGDLARLADEQSLIAVAPDSFDPYGEAWVDEEGGRDALLFDVIVACLGEQLGVDPDSIHVSGFSGGGVFATWLVMERAELLASAVLFSGGLDGTNLAYATPAADLPVLLSWGGDEDTASAKGQQVTFETLSLYFGDLLAADGHLVVLCDHGGGHVVPDAAPSLFETWSLAHRRGSPSPFGTSLDGLPNYCTYED